MSDEQDLPPPPSYDSVVGQGGNVAAPLLDQDDTQNTRSYTPTRLSASDSHRLTPFSDSPHSSDDEETSRMKSELRRLREEMFQIRSDSNRQEKKKQWLKEALEKEEREMRAATGYGPVQPSYGSVILPAPPYPHAQYGGANSGIQSQQGTVYHPPVTYNPNQPPTAGYVFASPSAPAQIRETPATAPAPSQQGTVHHPTVTYNPNQPPTAGYVIASPSAPAQIRETPATAPAPIPNAKSTWCWRAAICCLILVFLLVLAFILFIITQAFTV